MGKKTGIFTEGQYVFAKVKGYSPWPAKITKVIAKHKYGVYFYGTGETASVKSEDLDPYDEKNRGRFNTDRQLKKQEYKEAVDQIQAALGGNDPAPIAMEDKSFKNNNDNDVTADNITDNSADESQLQIAEDIPKATPPQKRKAAVAKVTPQFTPEPEAKENDEKVSRSGRKIKEKKMNTDEMDPDEMFTQPRKRLKVEEEKQKPVATPTDPTNAIDEFRACKMHVLQDPIKMKALENQYEMIHVMQAIKLALGLEEAEIDRSLELLETFKKNVLPHITDLMLLKYPNTVETVKRLRKYIGNLSSWAMEGTQVEEFHEKSGKIRTSASEIYDTFKTLFNFHDEASFWSKFVEQKEGFHQKYNNLSPADLFEGLSYEELDSLANNQHSEGVEETPTPSTQGDAVAPTQNDVPLEESAAVESETPNDEPMIAEN